MPDPLSLLGDRGGAMVILVCVAPDAGKGSAEICMRGRRTMYVPLLCFTFPDLNPPPTAPFEFSPTTARA